MFNSHSEGLRNPFRSSSVAELWPEPKVSLSFIINNKDDLL